MLRPAGIAVAEVAVPVTHDPLTGERDERRILGSKLAIHAVHRGARLVEFDQFAADQLQDFENVLASQGNHIRRHPRQRQPNDFLQMPPDKPVVVTRVQAAEHDPLSRCQRVLLIAWHLVVVDPVRDRYVSPRTRTVNHLAGSYRHGGIRPAAANASLRSPGGNASANWNR